MSDDQRIQALERKVESLEKRVGELVKKTDAQEAWQQRVDRAASRRPLPGSRR